MYKHLRSHKISKLLALSLALSFSSVCAAETVPAQTEIAETVAASVPAVEEIPTHYSLNLDASSFRKETVELKGIPLAFRVSDQNLYTAYPVSMATERLDIYIPEAYFHKKSLNGFTAKTAPVLMPLALETSNNIAAAESEDKTLIFQALEHGYVVVVPHKLVLQPSANERLGKAPLYLLEAKASIRYLRRNHHRLPAGDLKRIVVTGQGLGSALALQLAASCNQENYHPYLRGLGSAERSDHIFAAQACEPDLATVQDVHTYGWLLPDGRPDQYAVSRYLPLVDLKAALARSTAEPNIDSALAEPSYSEEEILENMDGTLTETDDAAAPESTEKEKQPKTKKASAKAAKFTYDTKEYREFLARQAAYEEAKKEYKQFTHEHLPISQNANYLQLCSSSESNARISQDLKTAFEKTGTKVEVIASSPQDAKAFFAWIDAADAEQDELDAELAKLRKKHQEKISRAKLLMKRAYTKAIKKQNELARQSASNNSPQLGQ